MIDHPRKPSDADFRECDPKTMPLAGYLADGRICRDLACCRCGYNLRTLSRDARCPECAMPVALSLQRASYGGFDPRWLRRVSRGLMLAACMPPLLCAFVVLMDGGGVRIGGMLIRLDVEFLVWFPIAGWLIGVWLFASPEPNQRSEANRSRRTVRIAACALLVTLLIAAIDDHWSIVPGQIAITIEIAVLLSATTLVGYAYILSKRFRRSEEKGLFDDLLPIGALGLVFAAVGIVMGILSSHAAEFMGLAGMCFLVPAGIMVNVTLLRLAYDIHRMADGAMHAGESDPPQNEA